MKAITIWGAASAAGAAARPARRRAARRLDRLAGAVLDRRRDRRGLHPDHARARSRSRATRTARDSIDYAGTVLIARRRSCRSCSRSARAATGAGRRVATIGCLVDRGRRRVALRRRRERVKAPLVDLELLRNRILVGATLAILIVAGTINAPHVRAEPVLPEPGRVRDERARRPGSRRCRPPRR